MSTLSTDRKLTFRELAGLPLANFGPTLQTCIQMYFLLYFFTNVLGISGTAAALIIMIARIWDFINDPLMAVLVEKTRRPEKCLFWMRVSLVPVLIFMVLTYTAPQFSMGGRIVWAALMFVGLGMSQTAYSIPLNTLRPMLTTDKEQRNRLNRVEMIVSIIGNLLIPTATMPLVALLQGYEVSAPFMILAAIYAVIYLICSTIGLHLLKGCEHDEIAQENAAGAKVTTRMMFATLLANKAALLILVTQVVKMFISSISGACMVYYYTCNIQNVEVMSLTTAIGGVIGILPVLFLVPLYKRFGNAGTAALGCVIGLAAMAVRFVTHDSAIWIILLMSAVESIGLEMASSMIVQCLMDALDYGEWRTGRKAVPIIMSAYGMGTKIGLAFGSSIAGLILGALHFDAEAVIQPQNVLNGFFHISVTLPMVMYLGMALTFAFLMRIERRLPEMRAEVEARNAATMESQA